MPIYISKAQHNAVPETQLQQCVTGLRTVINGSNTLNSPQNTRLALSVESLESSQISALNAIGNEFSIALESIIATLNTDRTLYTSAQFDAAAIAGIVSGDPRAFLNEQVMKPSVATESLVLVPISGADLFEQRTIGMEAYDERDNQSAAVYSIAYNMSSARQDEFGETLFPTIVVPHDQVGFDVTVHLLSVMDDFQRNISCAVDRLNRKNLIRAIADSTILKNDMTKIVPVVRAQSADKFVDPLIVAPRSLMLDGEAILTAPLKFGTKISLLGISQTDTLLAGGIMDLSDTIDTGSILNCIYVKVGDDDVLRFNTANLPLSNFVNAVQGNYRQMALNFDTTSVLVNKTTACADGSALTDLAAVFTQDLIVRLAVNITGTINIESAETVVYGNAISVHSIQNAAGEFLDLTAAPAAAIVALFEAADLLGYELTAYRTNINRRQRGQLINTTRHTQRYPIHLRSPITAVHPPMSDGQNDVSDLAALITGTRIRTSNASVTALVDAAVMLHDYVDTRDVSWDGPEILGAGRFFVLPTFFSETIDVSLLIDSLSSHKRAEDIQAVLVNKIRDYVFRMYTQSQYQPAADAIAGGISPMPVAIIATDPILERYLTVTGDLRTLGGKFDHRIVSTNDTRVSGKIFITFGVFNETRNTAVSPLNFGNMAWSPELTIVLPIARQGQISRELSVQPRFQHVVNLPIMTVLEISGIPDAINKVPFNFRTVI